MIKHSFLLVFLSASTLCNAQTVVDLAARKGHTAFAQAVKAAGLYDHAQKAEGVDGSMAPFTVLVPNNKAFDALSGLDADKKKKLVMFHVIPGQKLESAAAITADGVPTVGEQLVMGDGTKIHLDESTTTATIIGGPHQASNGVIYEIDTVLLPSGMDTTPKAAASSKEATQTTVMDPGSNPDRQVATQHPVASAPKAPEKATAAQTPQKVVTNMANQTVNSSTMEQMHSLQHSVSQLTQTMQLLIHTLQEQVVVEQRPAAQSLAVPGLQTQPIQPTIVVR